MDEQMKGGLIGFGIATVFFVVLGLVWTIILSLGAEEMTNNCFLAGEVYAANTLWLEQAVSVEKKAYYQYYIDQALIFADDNMCAPKTVR